MLRITIALSAQLALFTVSASALPPDEFDEDMRGTMEAREFAQAIAIAETCDIEMDMQRVAEVAGRFAKSDVIQARMFLQFSGRAHQVRFESMTAPEQAAACAMVRETARKHGLIAETGSVEAEPSATGGMNDCEAANPERSVRACTAVIESSESGSEVRAMAYVSRAMTRMKQGFQRGIDPLEENTLQLVIGDLNRAIRLKPDYARAYALRGASRGDLGQFDQAIADFDEAIRLDPDDEFAYYGRGRAHAAMGNIAEATADYTKSIRLDPEDADAYYNRGRTYAETGDHSKAIADFTEAIRLKPDHAIAFAGRGDAYYKIGDLGRTIADSTEAIQLKPDLAEAYLNRGAAFTDKGELQRARADLDKAIDLDPNDPLAYYNRGNVSFDENRFDKAIADYDKAIQLRSDYAPAYLSRGAAYSKKQELDKAITDYNEAIRLRPTYAFAYNNRGGAYFQKGQLDLAIADFSQAINLDLMYTAAYTHRGMAYQAAGQPRKAKVDYQAALAAPQKYGNGAWAHETARERLKALGAEPRPQDAADQQVAAAQTVPVPAKSGRPQLTSLTPRQVFARLTDRYTEAQREAWFETHADGKRVRWRIRVSDVSEGWFNYDVSGMFGPTRQVVCKVDITDENKAFMLNVNKGATLDCIGTLATYTKVLGTVTLLVDDAVIRK